MSKEQVIKLFNLGIDSHVRSGSKGKGYLDGVKDVRSLFDSSFEDPVERDKLLDFCISIICLVQPEDPQHNRELSEFDNGRLASSYLLYSTIDPVVFA